MKYRTITIVLVTALALFLMAWSFDSSAAGGGSKPAENDSVEANETSAPAQGDEDEDVDADLGKWGSRSGIERDTYLRLRDEYVARKRGIEPGRPFDPSMRGRAIEQMERQEKNSKIESLVNGNLTHQVGSGGTWTPIGPTSITNGQALQGGNTAVSGRVTAIVVDPGNASKVYLGTAQGGVWRSLDGGTTWSSIFDDAQSLAIGALALAPSDPTTLYVGTGEFNGCGDCFFGVGLYRIDNADAAVTLVGPINPSQTIGNLTYNIFNGRGITKIVVHPTDPATIFVSTARGIGGSGANALGLVPNLGTRGLYRSTNATSAAGSVTFQKLVVTTDNSPDIPATGNVDTTDVVMEPGVPNNLLVAVIGASTSAGGIYRTTNALAGTPTFTQVLITAAAVRTNLTINKVGSAVTAYAATSESAPSGASCPSTQLGAVRKQIDPFNDMATWPNKLTGGGGFCGGQCFYNITIAVNPTNASEVYLGGNARGTCSDGMKKSTNGGLTFTRDDSGLHADSHALFYDGAGATIFAGNDGGVWKRSSSATPATPWTNLNNAPLNTLQFESIAVHPLDRNLMIGGTQDNGTEYQQGAVGNWSNAEGGDGGYCLIDQSATDTTNVAMYHTFFNVTGTQIGFDRAVNTTCLPNKNFWPTRGVGFLGGGDPEQLTLSCDGTADYLHNGLSLTDNVLFYAPMALGPHAPNTVYFGTDRLYRSSDRGDHMTVVSQAPIFQISAGPPAVNSPISTIAIWPAGDNVRMVGLQNGQVWATSIGSSTLVNLTSSFSFPANPNGSTTNKFVGRAVIDPNNSNVAYVALSYFAPAGQGIWKITNLVAASGAAPAAPVWTAAGNGIPSVPINGLVIDPLNSNSIYAGTDIGVYVSTDGGANWGPFGSGLPRSAVFELAIQPSNRILRAGTHGRGVWETPLSSPAASAVQFNTAAYSVNESQGSITITVTRAGDTSGAATVRYATSDTAGLTACTVANGIASERCDYETTVGTVRFAVGETSKSFVIPIVNDVHVENNEVLTVTLSGPTGASLGAPSTATVTIQDNDAGGAANPIDGVEFFITQQYLDFLARLPDAGGLQSWVDTLGPCPNGGFGEFDNPNCDRVHVSAGFFLSEEFRGRGYWAYRFYEVAFNRRPTYAEFVPDMAQVGGSQSPQSEVLSKAAYTIDFAQRAEFQAFSSANPTNAGYVNALEANAEVTLPNKAQLVTDLGNGKSRTQVVREIVESQAVEDKFFIRAFVAMQYFGYVRRDPDTSGYNSWVTALTSNPSDFRHMIFGFIYSSEYRTRFGP